MRKLSHKKSPYETLYSRVIDRALTDIVGGGEAAVEAYQWVLDPSHLSDFFRVCDYADRNGEILQNGVRNYYLTKGRASLIARATHCESIHEKYSKVMGDTGTTMASRYDHISRRMKAGIESIDLMIMKGEGHHA